MEALKQVIQCLSKEILEISYLEIKLVEKKELGWDFVHYQIRGAPYCDKLQRIVKVLFLLKFSSVSIFMEELDRAIQNLPIEISEKIYKYYVTANLVEKKKSLAGIMFTSRFYQLLTATNAIKL